MRVTAVADAPPDAAFYASQKLVPGFNYITTRDGTTLSAYVTFPGPPDKGPYPTVVNYSGYDPSKPGEPLGNFGTICDDLPVLCDAPSDPSGLIAALMGFATVSVNMRGTGCSGGAYDYFEPLQLLDGYDVIETVAAQDWAFDHRVGMTGLSYPGITQMFVGKAKPPSLAAITPLSVIGNTYSTALPGGIFNDGFALEWISNVLDKAVPYGQGWEQAQVDKGDTVCEDNQYLHSQRADVVAKAKNTPYYSVEEVEPLNPTKFVKDIDVPVFLASAFQDEQTGPLFFTLLDQFKGSPLTRFTVYNGVHVDAFAPQVLVEWKAFLDIYVGKRVPVTSDLVRSLVPQLFENVFHTQMELPPDRFAKYATWEEAKAAFEAEKPVRAIFENGHGDPTNEGAPTGTFEMHFDAWPPADTTPTRFYFQPDGTLSETPPTATTGASSFDLDPGAGQEGILAPGGDVWDPLPAYAWVAPDAKDAVVFESAALTEDLVMLGTGSVDLFVRSTVDDADIEVNLTEIRPDGQEMYIQSGWLRASLRKLAPEATELWPEHTYLKSDEALLVPGEWTPMRIGIPAFSHVFRAGSKIRISVDTPGGSRAAWKFALKTFPGPVSYDVATNASSASSLVLPVLTGVASTTPLPPCPSLRGQPCRVAVPHTNTPAPN
ncbi:MAG: CocE/NonD family hydrolase [Polyangiaceae bacterium]